jgi:predicted naringenin-chalcone synthase
MSSPTVLFVLDRVLAARPPNGALANGAVLKRALLIGMGPGLTATGVSLTVAE